MSTHRIYDGIAVSPRLASVSAGAFRLWVILLTKTDSYGIYLADPQIILGRCLPLLMNRVNVDHVREWMAELIRAQLVHVYLVGDIWYVRYVNYIEHNQIQASRSRFPGPDGEPLQLKTVKSVLKSWDNRKQLLLEVKRSEQHPSYPYLVGNVECSNTLRRVKG